MEERSLYDYIRNEFSFEPARFASPDRCLYPIYYWVWNAKLSREEIVRQLDEMLEADILGFCIIPEPKNFRPTTMVTEMEPDYLTDEFMDYIRFTAECARERGMLMWLYDEGGWPSGNACGRIAKAAPWLGEKTLAGRKVTLPQGQAYALPEDALAAYVGKTRIRDGYTPERDTEVTEYFRKFTDFGNERQVAAPQADVTEPETVERFLNLTHEKYKAWLGDHIGTTCPIMFTDEPRIVYPAFCFDFEKRFYERYGYDILDHIPAILAPEGADDGENQVRIDYLSLHGEVFNEVYLNRCNEWSRKNGLLFGGHFGGDNYPYWCSNQSRTNIVNALRQLEIPGVDVIWRQIMPDERENDVDTRFFPRAAPSAAHMNGTKLALSESFAVYGNGVTPDEMRYVINHQTYRGINLHSFMLVSFGRDRYLAFSERPCVGAEKPGFRNLRQVQTYTARASDLAAIGESEIDTALYLPQNDVHAGGKVRRAGIDAYNALGDALERRGIEFDIIEDYGIREATVEGGCLVIGKAKYRHVYIPENRYIPADVLKKLQPFLTEASPACESTAGFADLRVSKRRMPDGSVIFFAYNEGKQTMETELTLPASASRVYELDLLRGEIYPAAFRFNLRLECGESKAYLVTDAVLPTAENPYEKNYANCIALENFEATKAMEFFLDAGGSNRRDYAPDYSPMALGAWEPVNGQLFSGEMNYRATVDLPQAPEGDVLLTLGKVEYSAEIRVNGQFGGNASLEPMQLVLDGKLFRAGENTVEIQVANTAANQFALSDADQQFLPEELGPYHERAKQYEHSSLGGGLYGPVVLHY